MKKIKKNHGQIISDKKFDKKRAELILKYGEPIISESFQSCDYGWTIDNKKIILTEGIRGGGNFLTIRTLDSKKQKLSTSEQRMVNQIKRAKKEGRGIYTLPMKTQDYYRRNIKNIFFQELLIN